MEQVIPPKEILSSSSSVRLKPFPETLFQNVPQDVLDIINQKRENAEVNGKFVNWLMAMWVNIHQEDDDYNKLIKPLNKLFKDNNIKASLKVVSYIPGPTKKDENESEEDSSLEELSEDEFSKPKAVKVKKESEEEYKIEYEATTPLVVSDKALVEFIYFMLNEKDFGENYDYDELNTKLYELGVSIRIIEINLKKQVPVKDNPRKTKTIYKSIYEISYTVPLKVKE